MLAKKKAGIVSVLIMLPIALTFLFGCIIDDTTPPDKGGQKPAAKQYQAQVGDIIEIKASPDPQELITADDY